MGYYTDYNLKVHEGNRSIESILEQVDGQFEDLEWAVDFSGDTNDSAKWYDHEIDMKKLSKIYPDIVFKLKGHGEESGDTWIKYFKNGKMQNCPAKITFDEYDEKKLK
jgi:hypothetical protein